jgi:hypothetical protein
VSLRKRLKNESWGTPESHFPFKIHTAKIEDSDIAWARTLTAQQRIEWLLMMQGLLIKQFTKRKKK